MANTKVKKLEPKIECFEGVDGKFYWRCNGDNGWIVCIGGEGFSRKRDIPRAVRNAADALATAAASGKIVDVAAP